MTTGGTVSIAAMTVSTVRPVIFCNLHRGPAVAAGRLVTALDDLPGATLYRGGGEGDAGAGRGQSLAPLLQRAAFALPAQAAEVSVEHRRLRPREAGRAGAVLPAVPVPRPVALVPLAPVAA